MSHGQPVHFWPEYVVGYQSVFLNNGIKPVRLKIPANVAICNIFLGIKQTHERILTRAD